MVTEEKTGEKATPEQVAARSVVKQPPGPATGGPPGLQTSLLFQVVQSADEIQPWGQNPKVRDRQLREFITTESLFASALGIVCARNAAFSWFLEGPKMLTARMQEALETANFGRGWQDLMLQTSVDLYTQDTGAFIEVVREGDTPDSPLLSLNHLDAERCYHTGHPEAPVIYEDRDAVYHLLNWWQVVTLTEMPTAEEKLAGLQWCALSRMLLAAQVTRSIAIYHREKASGRHTKAIHLVKGMTSGEIQDAVNQVKAAADSAGLTRYVNPIIVGSIDPRANLEATTLQLASLPEGYDEDKMYKWYISQIAMAFLTDYQEFAPLPGGGLGTSGQSQVLHLKSRGKGPGLFMKMIAQALNYKVLAGVQFGFEEQDLEAEQAEADTKLKRAETRAKKVESGELDEQGARQEALDVGDMSQETFDRLSATEDITPEVTIADEEREGAKTLAPLLVGLGSKAASVGQFLSTRIHKAFTQTADDLAALGYMDTAGRIKLSGLIGGVLRDLDQAMGSDVAAIVERNVADEDARRLVAQVAEKALAGNEVAGYHPFGWTETGKAAEPARAGPFEDERLVAERNLTDVVEKALKRTFARIKKKLREEAGRPLLELPWEISSKELKPGMFDDTAFWGLGKEELMKETSGQVDALLRAGASQAERLGLAVNFELVNQEVLGFAGKYSDTWWAQLQKTNRKALRAAIQTNISQGAPLKSLIKSLEPTFGRARAEMIASTEVTRLYAEGNRMAYASTGLIKQVEWRTVGDERMCSTCGGLEGKRWPLGKEGTVPPAHVSCLPGYARVSAKGIAASSERWYEGDLVVVRTASGKELACTPNHPVAADVGWVSAGSLVRGCYVVSSLGRQWRTRPGDDDGDDVPARIEHVAESFAHQVVTRTERVEVAAEDFHGDGIGSEVAVVRSDSLLVDDWNATRLQQGFQVELARTAVQAEALDGRGTFQLLGQGRHTALGELMGSRYLVGTVSGRHTGPFDGLGGALATRGNAVLKQDAADDAPVDPVSFAQELLGVAGDVFLDQVVQIRWEPFVGHVYNLQTATGWYVAEGIVTHNCRCWLAPVVDGEARTEEAKT